MDDIDSLKNEIKVLKKRVEILENNENKRKITKNVRIIFKICLCLAFVYGIYRSYNYIQNIIPNMIENKVKEINIVKR